MRHIRSKWISKKEEEERKKRVGPKHHDFVVKPKPFEFWSGGCSRRNETVSWSDTLHSRTCDSRFPKPQYRMDDRKSESRSDRLIHVAEDTAENNGQDLKFIRHIDLPRYNTSCRNELDKRFDEPEHNLGSIGNERVFDGAQRRYTRYFNELYGNDIGSDGPFGGFDTTFDKPLQMKSTIGRECRLGHVNSSQHYTINSGLERGVYEHKWSDFQDSEKYSMNAGQHRNQWDISANNMATQAFHGSFDKWDNERTTAYIHDKDDNHEQLLHRNMENVSVKNNGNMLDSCPGALQDGYYTTGYDCINKCHPASIRRDCNCDDRCSRFRRNNYKDVTLGDDNRQMTWKRMCTSSENEITGQPLCWNKENNTTSAGWEQREPHCFYPLQPHCIQKPSSQHLRAAQHKPQSQASHQSQTLLQPHTLWPPHNPLYLDQVLNPQVITPSHLNISDEQEHFVSPFQEVKYPSFKGYQSDCQREQFPKNVFDNVPCVKNYSSEQNLESVITGIHFPHPKLSCNEGSEAVNVSWKIEDRNSFEYHKQERENDEATMQLPSKVRMKCSVASNVYSSFEKPRTVWSNGEYSHKESAVSDFQQNFHPIEKTLTLNSEFSNISTERPVSCLATSIGKVNKMDKTSVSSGKSNARPKRQGKNRCYADLIKRNSCFANMSCGPIKFREEKKSPCEKVKRRGKYKSYLYNFYGNNKRYKSRSFTLPLLKDNRVVFRPWTSSELLHKDKETMNVNIGRKHNLASPTNEHMNSITSESKTFKMFPILNTDTKPMGLNARESQTKKEQLELKGIDFNKEVKRIDFNKEVDDREQNKDKEHLNLKEGVSIKDKEHSNCSHIKVGCNMNKNGKEICKNGTIFALQMDKSKQSISKTSNSDYFNLEHTAEASNDNTNTPLLENTSGIGEQPSNMADQKEHNAKRDISGLCSNSKKCNKNQLYRVTHKKLNVSDLKKSMQLTSKPVILTCSSVLTSVAMPVATVSMKNMSSAAKPVFKLHSSVKNYMLKEWERALSQKCLSGDGNRYFKDSLAIEMNPKGPTNVQTAKKIAENPTKKKSKFNKQKALLSLVKQKLDLKHKRNTFKDAKDDRFKENGSITDEKSGENYDHPKLRHKVIKDQVNNEEGHSVECLTTHSNNDMPSSNIEQGTSKHISERNGCQCGGHTRDVDGISKKAGHVHGKNVFAIKRIDASGAHIENNVGVKNSLEQLICVGGNKTTEDAKDSNSSSNCTSTNSTDCIKGSCVCSTQSTLDTKHSQKRKAEQVSTESSIGTACKIARNNTSISGKIDVQQTDKVHQTETVDGGCHDSNKQTKHLMIGTDVSVIQVGAATVQKEDTTIVGEASMQTVVQPIDDLNMPMAIDQPRPNPNPCFAIQCLHGPIVSSTYYKQKEVDETNIRVIRHAKEELLDYPSNSVDDDDADNDNVTPDELSNKAVEKLSSSGNSSPSDTPELIIDLNLPDLEIAAVDTEYEHLAPSSTNRPVDCDKDDITNDLSLKQPADNLPITTSEKSVVDGTFTSLAPLNESSYCQNSEYCDEGYSNCKAASSGKHYRLSQQMCMTKDPTYEMHSKYVDAKKSLDFIDGTRSYLPLLPVFAPDPYDYMQPEVGDKAWLKDVVNDNRSRCINHGLNELMDLNRYSPTQEDFEQYKLQRQRFCDFNLPSQLYSGTENDCIAYQYCQNEERSPPSSFCKKEAASFRQNTESRIVDNSVSEFVAVPLSNICDSTTKSSDGMIGVVSSTGIFDPTGDKEIDKVIEEVVAEEYLCSTDTAPDLVNDFSWLPDERLDDETMKEDMYNEYGTISNDSIKHEATDTDSQSWQSKQYKASQYRRCRARLTTQRRHWYCKRFPMGLAKAKKEKYIAEKALYTSAVEFLGDFDKNNKQRTCRKLKQNESSESICTQKIDVAIKQENVHSAKKEGYSHATVKQEKTPTISDEKKSVAVKLGKLSKKIDKKCDDKEKKTYIKKQSKDGINNESVKIECVSKVGQTTEEIKKAIHTGEITSKVVPKLRMADVLSSKLKHDRPMLGKGLGINGKLLSMREHFDKKSRTKCSKINVKGICNKTPYIKVKNLSDGKMLENASKASLPKKENSYAITLTDKYMFCNVCDALVKASGSLQHHYSKVHRTWCLHCQRDLKEHELLMKHKRRNHDIPTFCGMCGLKFLYKKSYNKHCASVVHLENMKKDPRFKGSSGPYQQGGLARNVVISISSEKSSDEAVHYISSGSDDVFTSPERNSTNFRKGLKKGLQTVTSGERKVPTSTNQGSAPVENNSENVLAGSPVVNQVQKHLQAFKPQIKKDTKHVQTGTPLIKKVPRHLQTGFETRKKVLKDPQSVLQVVKKVKTAPPAVKNASKTCASGKQSCKTSTSTQTSANKSSQPMKESVTCGKKRFKTTTDRVSSKEGISKPLAKNCPRMKNTEIEMEFCDYCKKCYKIWHAHIKTDKHLVKVQLHKKQKRLQRMAEARRAKGNTESSKQGKISSGVLDNSTKCKSKK